MTGSGQRGVHLRPAVQHVRQLLAQGRAELAAAHAGGAAATHVCSGLTELAAAAVKRLYAAAIDALDTPRAQRLDGAVTLVAHSGFARGDMAPFSDVDLMLLHAPAVHADVPPLAQRLVQDIGDSGLALGFSVRTGSVACSMALDDAVILTSLLASHRLCGDQALFDEFARRLQRSVHRQRSRLIELVRESRRSERVKYGATVNLLQPNVKRSPGGLRDVQLLRWLGAIRYGHSDPQSLHDAGLLNDRDLRKLREAVDLLLGVRNEMHFHANRAQDLLDRSEQMRLADRLGYAGDEERLPVEKFMQHYFRLTSEVRNIVANFAAGAALRRVWSQAVGSLLAHRMEGDFRVGQVHIAATRRGRTKLKGNTAEVLRLMDLANLANKRIDHPTWEAIRDDMTALRDNDELSDVAIKRFLSLLSQPMRLGDLLRRLHELHVLQKLVPGMGEARGLLQFNDYHKYTIDEHCLQSVERATEYLDDPGPVGNAYRRIKQKRTLHLALLIHDLGKASSIDHSEKGLELATQAAARLKLSREETEVLQFLVHKHLMMSHLAFRRDTTDETAVVQFAVEVGSPEVLRMLFVLTCADLAAVGPGAFTSWKCDVLTRLFHDARHHLTGGAPSPDFDQRLAQRRSEIQAQLDSQGNATDADEADWHRRQIGALPPAYLYAAEPRQIADELQRVRQLPDDDAAAWGRYVAQQGIVEFTVATHEQLVPGIFHRLTGALTSQGLQILSAEIHTLADGLVLDRFCVEDADFDGQPPPERFAAVCGKLVDALKRPSSELPRFRRLWRDRTAVSAAHLVAMPTRVRFDTSTSEQFTIVDVFAHDRSGLLYTIARALYELDTSVGLAKIGTYLDQVVDVFYVTDQQGRKIEDRRRLDEIERSLLEAIARLEPVDE